MTLSEVFVPGQPTKTIPPVTALFSISNPVVLTSRSADPPMIWLTADELVPSPLMSRFGPKNLAVACSCVAVTLPLTLRLPVMLSPIL